MMRATPVETAEYNGYKTGRNNRHSSDIMYATSEEWAAFLEGWRTGYKEFLAANFLKYIPPPPRKKLPAQQRRSTHLERKYA